MTHATARDTYTPEGWAALNRAARAMRYAYASRDQKLIDLSHDVFKYTLARVNRDCVARVDGEAHDSTSKESA